jgi:hypothetical protein
MKQLLGLLLLTLIVQPLLAKDDYPLTIRVLSTQNVKNENGTLIFAKFDGNADGPEKLGEHVIAEGSDGNTYELVPESPNDMLLPGTFQAKIRKRGMKVCEPNNKGKCRDVKFKIMAAQQTPAPQQAVCINEVVCTLLQINLTTRTASK